MQHSACFGQLLALFSSRTYNNRSKKVFCTFFSKKCQKMPDKKKTVVHTCKMTWLIYPIACTLHHYATTVMWNWSKKCVVCNCQWYGDTIAMVMAITCVIVWKKNQTGNTCKKCKQKTEFSQIFQSPNLPNFQDFGLCKDAIAYPPCASAAKKRSFCLGQVGNEKKMQSRPCILQKLCIIEVIRSFRSEEKRIKTLTCMGDCKNWVKFWFSWRCVLPVLMKIKTITCQSPQREGEQDPTARPMPPPSPVQVVGSTSPAGLSVPTRPP